MPPLPMMNALPPGLVLQWLPDFGVWSMDALGALLAAGALAACFAVGRRRYGRRSGHGSVRVTIARRPRTAKTA